MGAGPLRSSPAWFKAVARMTPSHTRRAHTCSARLSPRRCDTVLIMETKQWCCKILGLVCTARLDLRLSLLLQQYAAEYQAGLWPADSAGLPSSPLLSSPLLKKGVEKAKWPKATASGSNKEEALHKGKASSATSGVKFAVVGASAATSAGSLGERHDRDQKPINRRPRWCAARGGGALAS